MATTRVAKRPGPLAALLAAEVISTTGLQMTLLALPWFVLVTTGSPARMGLVVAADLLPMVLLAIPGGALAGRLGARRTMLACDLARLPLIGLVPLLHALGMLSFPVLVGLVALHGMFWPLYWASQGALLPELVGDDQQRLTRASALFQAATRLTLLVGPALGGVLIGWLGPAEVLVVDAASYLVAFMLVAGFVPAGGGRPAAAEDLRGMLAGVRVLLGDRLLRAWALAASLSQMGFQTLLMALPVLAFTRHGQDPRVAGLLIGAWGGGAMLGSLAALRLPSRFAPLTVASLAGLGQALPLWLLVAPLPAPVAVAVLGLAGLANGIRVPPLRAVTLLRIPPGLRVQAMTAESTLSTAAGLLALGLAGPALEAWGPRRCWPGWPRWPRPPPWASPPWWSGCVPRAEESSWREAYGGDLSRGEGERQEVGVELDHSMRDGCVVVTLTGQINLFTAPRIQRVLLKDLAERPYGIVCDLTGVESIDPVCTSVFSTVATHPSSDWPATSFLLCAARPAVAEVLERVALPRFLPLFSTLEEALHQIAVRPPYLRDELALAPTTTAPAAARLYVRDVLQYWRLALPGQEVIDRAELLADELVTNAVVHARTPLRLRLELRGDLLHIAVHDASPRLLRLVPENPESEAGRGLRLVERLASAWGVHRRPPDGKVVWCTLRLWQRPGPAASSGS